MALARLRPRSPRRPGGRGLVPDTPCAPSPCSRPAASQTSGPKSQGPCPPADGAADSGGPGTAPCSSRPSVCLRLPHIHRPGAMASACSCHGPRTRPAGSGWWHPAPPHLSTSTSRTLAIFPLSAPVTTPQDPGAHPGHSPHPRPGPPRSHRQPPPAPPRPLSPQCLLRAAVQADRRGRCARRGRAGGQARGLALGRQPPVLHLPRQPAVPRLRGHPAELPVAADGRPLLPGEKVRVGTLPRAGLCARAAKASAGRSAARATRGPLPAGRCTSGG